MTKFYRNLNLGAKIIKKAERNQQYVSFLIIIDAKSQILRIFGCSNPDFSHKAASFFTPIRLSLFSILIILYCHYSASSYTMSGLWSGFTVVMVMSLIATFRVCLTKKPFAGRMPSIVASGYSFSLSSGGVMVFSTPPS